MPQGKKGTVTLMRNGSYTIRKIHEIHLQENPDSMVSEKMIRAAVKDGSLPAVWAGNRALVSWVTFENWRQGNKVDEQ